MKLRTLLCSLAISCMLGSFALAQRTSSSNDRSDRSDRSSDRDSSASKSDRGSDESTASDRKEEAKKRSEHAGLGVTLSQDSQGRILITSVAAGSPAERAGLQAGDQLLKVDGERVDSAQDVIDDIRDKDAGSRIGLQIRRNGHRQDLRAKLVALEEAFRRVQGRTYSEEGRGDAVGEQGYASTNTRNAQGGLDGAIQALQQQVTELRREVRQLRQQQSSQSYKAGYRGAGDQIQRPAAGSQRSSSTGGNVSGDEDSQDRNDLSK